MTLSRRMLPASLVLTALAATTNALAQTERCDNLIERMRAAKMAEDRFYTEKAIAVMSAKAKGLPIRIDDPKTGISRELMKLAPNGMPIYYETRNLKSAKTIRADLVFLNGAGGRVIHGETVIVGVWDAGVVRGNHVEFEGRSTYFNAVPLNDHATHVAGTIAAAGLTQSTIDGIPTPGAARGIAPKAQIHSYDWNNAITEAVNAHWSGSNVRHSAHSYGPTTGWAQGDFGAGPGWYWFGNPADSQNEDSRFGRYGTEAAEWDAAVYGADNLVPVWAGGNDRFEGPPVNEATGFYWNGTAWTPNLGARSRDGGVSGYDTISGAAVGKNVLTVGAVNPVANYTGPDSVTIAPFSASGPTDDGRIKPDVVASGMGVFSTIAATSNSFDTFSGTSMAAASVTGALALTYNMDQGGDSGIIGFAYKHMIIHTAREAGLNPGPDYQYGYGLVDAEAAVNMANDNDKNREVVRWHSVNTNMPSRSYFVTSEGNAPLRVSLNWLDQAAPADNSGLDSPTNLLKNDLDIRVKKGNVTYYPWVLNPASPSSPATTGDNTVDTVEVIDIPAPAPGIYEIIVSGKGPITGYPMFSMIATGVNVLPHNMFLTLNGSYITGTNSTTARVGMSNPAPAGGTKVWARVEPAGLLNVTNPITIPEGETGVDFPIVGVGNVPAKTAFKVFVHTGYKMQSKSGFVTPLRMASMSLNSGLVSSGSNVLMTVKLNGPAPIGGFPLTIERSPMYWVMAPTSFTIPQGQFETTVSVPIRPGAPAISNARLTVVQPIPGSPALTMSKLFNIAP